ncbi:MAG: UvrB/UvrC motif-containing protein [bacterium]|nr:UvrB/UvrC motif-containing protein [bacterium]
MPKSPGVYIFRNNEAILYIGKAINIKERVKQHKKLLSLAKQLGFIKTNSGIEALILEANLIKKYRPKYNIVWKDDKNYFYVAITKESFPRVFIVHQKQENAKHIGPFVEGGYLKRSLTFLRKVFPYYTLRPSSGQAAKKHPKASCLWCDLKLCPGPNPDKKDYQKNIKSLIAVLQGKSKTVLKNLKKEMKKRADSQDYEKAAKIREKILALERVLSHSNVLEPIIEEKIQFQNFGEAKRTASSSSSSLSLCESSIIEAYDVSNMQGKDAAAAMVTFINGRPAKNLYRKFKIRIAGKPDDIAMLKEALSRRLKHLEWPMPDLILIDGGKAQLNAAIKSLPRGQAGKNIQVMALAKKENKLYVENLKKPILLEKMPREIFNLILRLRDEAHRFAISYHKQLRKNRLLGK